MMNSRPHARRLASLLCASAALSLFSHAALVAQCGSLGVLPDADHSIVVNPSGVVFAWGNNLYGNLGTTGNAGKLGGTLYTTSPAPVLKGAYAGTQYLGDNFANPITAAAASPSHSLALGQDGLVYAWGDNVFGQLGTNNAGTDSYIPVKVLKGAYAGTTYLGDNASNQITMIAAGGDRTPGAGFTGAFSLALAEDGTIYSWGGRINGRLGDGGATTGNAPVPVRVVKGASYTGTTYLGDNAANPVVAVATGEYHGVALMADGTVYVWGDNSDGQLGQNAYDATLSLSNVPMKVLKGAYNGTTYLGDNPANPIVAISAGRHQVMALAADGTIYMWGDNRYGQLGDGVGANVDRTTPVRVVKGVYTGTTYLGDNAANPVVQISTGGHESLARTQNGTIYAWGKNDLGQLGTGSTGADQASPVLTQTSTHVIIDISAGEDHGLALTSTCCILAWGNNIVGQLGNGGTTANPTPRCVQLDGGDFVLPVELSFFNATRHDGLVDVVWRTGAEVNNKGFEVQRRVEDGGEWQTISFVAGHGTTSQPYTYTASDEITRFIGATETRLQYRLRQVDLDGRYHDFDPVTVSIAPASTGSSSILKLGQNTPNPFVNSTTIEYSIPSEGWVTIELSDENGKLVRTLLDETVSAGTHILSFDADRLPSGVYFYRMTAAGKHSGTKRMVIVR